MSSRTGAKWNRDEQLVALRLYLRTPFGQLHQHNEDIKQLAEKLERTPDAIGMKACNFASLDPDLPRQGLKNVSEADRLLWNEFTQNPEAIVIEADLAFERLTTKPVSAEESVVIPTGETEVSRWVRVRRVQSFFRDAVLVSYQNRCAISGLDIPELLVASHIIPWKDNVDRRADPKNGLCLNALFDRAFDRGYITINDNHTVVVSKRLVESTSNLELHCSLSEAHGRPLHLPNRFLPDPTALTYHRMNVFKD
jgi:putative restriction endonuclease